MHTHYQRFFYIRRAAGARCKTYERWKLAAILVFHGLQSILYIIHQLFCVRNANVNGCLHAYSAAAFIGRAQNHAACSCHQKLTGSQRHIAITQRRSAKIIEQILLQHGFQLRFIAKNFCPFLLRSQIIKVGSQFLLVDAVHELSAQHAEVLCKLHFQLLRLAIEHRAALGL